MIARELVLIIAAEKPDFGIAKKVKAIGGITSKTDRDIDFLCLVTRASKKGVPILLQPGIWTIERVKSQNKIIIGSKNNTLKVDLFHSDNTFHKDVELQIHTTLLNIF